MSQEEDDSFTLLTPTSERIMTPPESIYSASEVGLDEERYETLALSSSPGNAEHNIPGSFPNNTTDEGQQLNTAFHNDTSNEDKNQQHFIRALNNYNTRLQALQPRVCTCANNTPKSNLKSNLDSPPSTIYDDVFLHLIHLKYSYQREIIPIKDICSIYDGLPNWDLFTSWLPSVPGFRTMWGNRDAFQLSFDPKKDVIILEKKYVITNQKQLRSTLRYMVSQNKDLGIVEGVVCGKMGLMVESSHGWEHHFECK